MRPKLDTVFATAHACTGCGACAAVCPVSALHMVPDQEGFAYPCVDTDACTSCGLCRTICPSNNVAHETAKRPISVFAAWHMDDRIRRESTSGGVFSALADEIINRGGAVVGAAYDEDLRVNHSIAEEAARVSLFRGSKYVQSNVSKEVYVSIKQALKDGRCVLFSGTPCQIAGLRAFLSKEEKRLICCDLVCHGTPSPKLFSQYIDAIQQKGKKRIVNYVFRSKANGWKKLTCHYSLEDGSSVYVDANADPYFRSFLRNYSLRPSCYSCRYACLEREGDVTLGDFWGIRERYPMFDADDRGTSLILVNTGKGSELIASSQGRLALGVADLDAAVAGNQMLQRPVDRPILRDRFYGDLATLGFWKLSKRPPIAAPSPLLESLRLLKTKVKSSIKARVPRR